MRKIISSFFILFAITNSIAQQVPNRSFEDWNIDHFDDLLYYFDSSNEGSHAIFKMTDAYEGNYSVKLQTHSTSTDTIPGFFINFDPESFTGGFPYTSHVDSVTFRYKANLIAQDSAIFLALFKNNQSVIGGKIIKIAADRNTNTWTRYSFPTDMPSNIQPDTLMLGVASSNAIDEIGMEPGSWIQIDDIQFIDNSGGTPNSIPNQGFEQWQDLDVEKPQDWFTSLEWDISTTPLSIEKITNVTDGNYAVKFENVITNSQDIIQGFMTNGVLDDNWPPTGGMVLNQTPLSVSYDILTNRVMNDECIIDLYFYNNGTLIYQDARSYSSNTVGYYHEVINIPSGIVTDALVMTFWNGEQPGSTMYIDNIVLEYTTGIDEYLEVLELQAFPVPTNDYLNFKLNVFKDANFLFNIYDLNGRQLLSKKLKLNSGETQFKIDISNLSSGTYIYKFITPKGQIAKKIIKK